jgi:hypothetical protein
MKTQKLTLNKETLQRLTNTEEKQVMGGGWTWVQDATQDSLSCWYKTACSNTDCERHTTYSKA